MNYFAHGYRFLGQPWRVAGTAVPDLLRVSDRAVRARSKLALPFLDDPDPDLAALAAGIVQHHQDDAWFHDRPAFLQLSWRFTLQFRELLGADAGFRPSFLGHILVELLLDGILISRTPERAVAYYQSLESLHPRQVAQYVERITGREGLRLANFLPRFCAERFLLDYQDDARLLYRLNMVMRRVRLPPLPDRCQRLFAPARGAVAQQAVELLPNDFGLEPFEFAK